MDLSKTFTNDFAIQANKTEGFKTTTTPAGPAQRLSLADHGAAQVLATWAAPAVSTSTRAGTFCATPACPRPPARKRRPVMKPVTTLLAARAVCAALALAVPACSGGGGRSSAAVASRNGDGAPAVRIIVGGLDKQIYLPVTLARELGYYQAQGLDVRFYDEPDGVEAETAMISGQVDAVVGFYDHTVDLRSKGRSTESVVQLLRAPGEVKMVRTDEAGSVKSPADFGGKHLGVTGLGSSTNFLTQYLEAKNGVKAGSATSVAVGAGSTFVAAMQNKQIDAGMTTEPTVSLLERKKLAEPLIDLRTAAGAKATLGGTYPASCLPHHRVRPEEPGGGAEAGRRLRRDAQVDPGPLRRRIADKMPAAYYAGVGKAVYTQALQNEKGMYSPDGLMPAHGPRTVYKEPSPPSTRRSRVTASICPRRTPTTSSRPGDSPRRRHVAGYAESVVVNGVTGRS